MDKSKSWKKPFLTLYLGQAFSILSSSAVQFSIIWWITSTTGSAMAITIASIVGLLPQAIIGPFAGVWIDRFNRKTIMVMADTLVAIASLILFILCFSETPPLWMVYVVLFMRAIGETFHKPSLSAAIPQLVPKEELIKAGGLGQLVNSACSIIGPMLGALLMSVATLQVAMFVDIVGAILAVLILLTIKLEKPVSATGGKIYVIDDMKKGLTAIKENKAIVSAFIPFFITTIIFTPIGNMLPLMVKNYFGGTAWHSGLVQTIFSLGMLIAAGMVGGFGGLKKQFFMISLSIITLGIAAMFGGLVSPSMFWIFCICVFIIGASAMCFNIPFNAFIQKSVAEEHLGKVMSLMASILSFAAPIGMLISGPIAEKIGVSNWMIGAGILVTATGVLSFFMTRQFETKEITK